MKAFLTTQRWGLFASLLLALILSYYASMPLDVRATILHLRKKYHEGKKYFQQISTKKIIKHVSSK